MSRRRRMLLAVASSLALVLVWSALPPHRAGESDSMSARPVPSSPLASRQPARVQERAQSTAPAPAAAKTGIPACDRFVERSMTCAQLPDDAKIAIAEASKAWAQLTAAGPRPDLEASCRATASVQGEALAAMGC
jgi:hypothetical protein